MIQLIDRNANVNQEIDMQLLVLFDRQCTNFSSFGSTARRGSVLTFLLIVLIACLAAIPARAADRFRGVRFAMERDDGSPVAGATIELFESNGQQMTSTNYTLQTGADGKGEFDTVPKADSMLARIQADGYATEMLSLHSFTSAKRNASHVLSAPAHTSIKVTDPDGNAVVGAEIQAMEYIGPSGKKTYINMSHADTYLADFRKSGPGGVLALPALPTGAKLTAGVIHSKWASNVVELDVTDGATATVELKPGIPVSIQLQVAGESDLPIDGTEADVIVARVVGSPYGAGSADHRFTVSNNQIQFTTGRYNIDWVDVSINGYFVGPQHVDIAKRTKQELESRSPQPRVVELQAHPKIPMRGRVFNHKGRPMKGVEMTGILIDSGFDKQDATIRERRMAMTSLGHTKTDQNGEYEIDLAPGTALVGAVRANHFSSPLIVRLDVDPENNKAISDISFCFLSQH